MRRALRLAQRSAGRGIHTLFQTPPATAPIERATPVLFLPDAFYTPDGFASFLEPRFRARGFSTWCVWSGLEWAESPFDLAFDLALDTNLLIVCGPQPRISPARPGQVHLGPRGCAGPRDAHARHSPHHHRPRRRGTWRAHSASRRTLSLLPHPPASLPSLPSFGDLRDSRRGSWRRSSSSPGRRPPSSSSTRSRPRRAPLSLAGWALPRSPRRPRHPWRSTRTAFGRAMLTSGLGRVQPPPRGRRCPPRCGRCPTRR